MCKRFKLTTSPQALADLLELAELPAWEPRHNISPRQRVLVVRQDPVTRQKTAALVTWGSVTDWSHDSAIFIIARSEAITETRSFANAIRNRRCLSAADGYYEWVKRGGRKQPHLIQLKDRRPFAFAGFWKQLSEDNGTGTTTCLILTMAASLQPEPLTFGFRLRRAASHRGCSTQAGPHS